MQYLIIYTVVSFIVLVALECYKKSSGLGLVIGVIMSIVWPLTIAIIILFLVLKQLFTLASWLADRLRDKFKGNK